MEDGRMGSCEDGKVEMFVIRFLLGKVCLYE